jgi:hypothetical protein
MRRPDYSRMSRQMRDMAQFIGETATWRKYVSAGGGNDAYGVAATNYYTERVISGLFAPVESNTIAFWEMMGMGGTYMQGDMEATLIDCQPGSQDQIIWQGVSYEAVSDPIPMRIVNRNGYRLILRRGDATG